ncbi:MAG: nucleotidyltransferase family protein, partial [Eubacteriales bacterium]
TSCDIDLLITPEDVETASSALTEQLGYQRGKAGAHDVAFLSPCGVHLELHFTLMEEKSDSRIQKTLSRVWEYALPSSERAESCVYRLRQEFVYFYHIAHMVKHFKYGGCGIRPFMDLWILEHCGPVFDAAEVEQLLMEGGILTFAEQARLLSEAWFSGVLPEPESRWLLDSMEDYLFAGGVYGSTENRVKVGRLEKEGKLHYLCSRLFLPYESMKYDYPILQKHRALLPVCEIHRWFRLFSGDTARRISQEVKDNSALTDEERSVMRDLFRGLGLQ